MINPRSCSGRGSNWNSNSSFLAVCKPELQPTSSKSAVELCRTAGRIQLPPSSFPGKFQYCFIILPPHGLKWFYSRIIPRFLKNEPFQANTEHLKEKTLPNTSHVHVKDYSTGRWMCVPSFISFCKLAKSERLPCSDKEVGFFFSSF